MDVYVHTVLTGQGTILHLNRAQYTPTGMWTGAGQGQRSGNTGMGHWQGRFRAGTEQVWGHDGGRGSTVQRWGLGMGSRVRAGVGQG